MYNIDHFLKIGSRIEHAHEFIRIDSYLAKKFPFLSRVKWQKRIEKGEICIATHHSQKMENVKLTYKLKKYDQIWYYQAPVEQKLDHGNIEVIYDDSDICIFSKPPHMVVHPVGVHGKNNFITHIRHMGYTDCAPVHRIDRETSGLLVCARKAETRRQISQLFREGAIQKIYLAITKGEPRPHENFTVSTPIGRAENSAIRLKSWINGQNSVPALTAFQKLAATDNYHLFACYPKTGRTNQIRIHLASVGQWIVGDKMYHPDEKVFLEFYEKGYTEWVHQNVLFSRHLLHNAGIFIPGFLTKFIFSPVPQDMLQFCTQNVTKDIECLQLQKQ